VSLKFSDVIFPPDSVLQNLLKEGEGGWNAVYTRICLLPSQPACLCLPANTQLCNFWPKITLPFTRNQHF